MAFFVTLAFETDRSRQLTQLRRVVLALALLVTVDELLQLRLPHRTFSVADLLANYLGILVCSL